MAEQQPEVLSEQTRDQESLDNHLDWVRSIAGSLMKQMDLPTQEFDDLVAAGYLGLIEASERFDSSHGRTLRQFASLRVRGAIIDSIRKNCDLSARAYRYSKALEAANELREEEPQSDTTKEALARALDYAAKGAIAFRLSLDDSECTLELEDQSLNPEEALDRKKTFANVREFVDLLDEPERSIVKGYYFEYKNFPAIATENGWNKSWVSKLHKRAMNQLRELIEARENREEAHCEEAHGEQEIPHDPSCLSSQVS